GAEVALLQRDLVRALRFLPRLLALQLEQLHGAALGDHLLVALDLLFCVLCEDRSTERSTDCCAKPKKLSHATAVSVWLVSPWLSIQLTSIRSPLAPPLRWKVN